MGFRHLNNLKHLELDLRNNYSGKFDSVKTIENINYFL